MWFLESEHDVEPFDVAQTALASDAMWLVEGPTDPRPMPLSEQATSKRPRPTTGGGAAAPAAPGPSKTQRRGSITAKEADAAAAADVPGRAHSGLPGEHRRTKKSFAFPHYCRDRKGRAR